MTDLKAKFTALEQQMTAQHQEVMTALNNILAALNAVPPGTVDLAPLMARLASIEEDTEYVGSITYSGINVLLNRIEQGTLQTAQLRDQFTLKIGPGTDEAPDVLTALDRLISNTACLCDGDQDPGAPEPEGCTTPIRSSGVAVKDGRAYVVWNPAPAGLTDASSSVPGAPAGSVLTPNAGAWVGWSLWVSGPASLYSERYEDDARYDTREWRELWPQPYPLCVSVPGEGRVTAWLCPPGATPPAVTCYDLSSTIATLTTPGGYSHTRRAAVWPQGWATSAEMPFGEHHTWDGPYNVLADLAGATVELLEGEDVRVYTASDTAYLEVLHLAAVGDKVTLTMHSTRGAIDDWTSNDIGPRAPFRVRFCLPPDSGGE